MFFYKPEQKNNVLFLNARDIRRLKSGEQLEVDGLLVVFGNPCVKSKDVVPCQPSEEREAPPCGSEHGHAALGVEPSNA